MFAVTPGKKEPQALVVCVESGRSGSKSIAVLGLAEPPQDRRVDSWNDRNQLARRRDGLKILDRLYESIDTSESDDVNKLLALSIVARQHAEIKGTFITTYLYENLFLVCANSPNMRPTMSCVTMTGT